MSARTRTNRELEAERAAMRKWQRAMAIVAEFAETWEPEDSDSPQDVEEAVKLVSVLAKRGVLGWTARGLMAAQGEENTKWLPRNEEEEGEEDLEGGPTCK